MKRKIKTRKYTNIYKVLPYMNVIQSYISWTLTRSCTCRSIGRRDIGHSGKWWVPDEGGYAMTYESLNWWYNNHFSDSYTSKHMYTCKDAASFSLRFCKLAEIPLPLNSGANTQWLGRELALTALADDTRVTAWGGRSLAPLGSTVAKKEDTMDEVKQGHSSMWITQSGKQH